ncbi:MAG: DUF4861 domain-containing protein [Sphingomonadales bacterium]|nr:DUF4861 domain-containing protein [Sphingomonadales bacterium]
MKRGGGIGLLLITALIAGAALLSSGAMASEDKQAEANVKKTAVAQVDLRIAEAMDTDSKSYVPVSSITVPESHKIGNKYFPYEGIGWENELIGYRIYLDERAVADVFGKMTREPALQTIVQNSKYHELAPWGLDVMHVGPSMGIGGLGLYRDGRLQRFGKDATLSADVISGKGRTAEFQLTHSGVEVGGKSGYVRAKYQMVTGSPVTWVSVESSLPENTLASGLVTAANAKLFTPKSQSKAGLISRIGAMERK